MKIKIAILALAVSSLGGCAARGHFYPNMPRVVVHAASVPKPHR